MVNGPWAAVVLAAACLARSEPAFAETETAVDLELVLAADVSDSMAGDERRLQREGYVAALRAPEVVAAMTGGLTGRIALTYVEWGDAGLAQVVVPWTIVASRADAAAVSARIERARAASATKTSISEALLFTSRLFAGNGFASERRIIDISGNGPNNQGSPVERARDAVVADGVTINGLPILADLEQPRGIFRTGFDRRLLDRYYAHCVVGGAGAFVYPVYGLEEFSKALRRKLVIEIVSAAGSEEWPRPIFAAGVAGSEMPC